MDGVIYIYIEEPGVFGFGIERSYGCDARYTIEGFDYEAELRHDEYTVLTEEDILNLFE